MESITIMSQRLFNSIIARIFWSYKLLKIGCWLTLLQDVKLERLKFAIMFMITDTSWIKQEEPEDEKT